ncbi:Unknown protein sequence [Pseudomonas syringae pv. maculicola]|nr:Unknown protein sequence [Pseudomonas syringae pv. maculicola]
MPKSDNDTLRRDSRRTDEVTDMKSLSRAEYAYDARYHPVWRNAFFMPDRNFLFCG